MTHRSWIQAMTGVLVTTLLLSTVVSGIAVAQISPPASYYGDAVTEDGTEAPQDTTIVAVVDGSVEDEITISTAGEYGSPDDDEYLNIPSNAESVTFHVGSASGPQADPPGTVTNIENGVERQDLTFPTGAFTSGGGDDGSTDDGSTDDGSTDNSGDDTSNDASDGDNDDTSSGGGGGAPAATDDETDEEADDVSEETDGEESVPEDNSEGESAEDENSTDEASTADNDTDQGTATDDAEEDDGSILDVPGFGPVVALVALVAAALLATRRRD